jgi:hypothetical protein
MKLLLFMFSPCGATEGVSEEENFLIAKEIFPLLKKIFQFICEEGHLPWGIQAVCDQQTLRL